MKNAKIGGLHMPGVDPDVPEPARNESAEEAPSEQSPTLLTRVRSLFVWIAKKVTQEAKNEPTREKEEARRILKRYKTKDLLQKSEAIVDQIEQARQELLKNWGESAQGFITRHIDPVFQPVKRLALLLEQKKDPEEGLRNVVATVELLTLLNDDSRLKRKIAENLVRQTQQAILEDIAFMMSYPTELVEEGRIPVQERTYLLQQIENDLHPVLEQMEALLSTAPLSPDFSHLFEWRTTIDVQRQKFHDKAMYLIEDKVRTLRQLHFSMDEPILPLEGEVVVAPPLTIPEIEESLLSLLHIVRRKDPFHFGEKERRLFESIKRQVQTLLDSEERYEHEEAISRLFTSIHRLEELLGMSEE